MFSLEDDGRTFTVKWEEDHIGKFDVQWIRFHCNCKKCWRPFIGMYPLNKPSVDNDIKITEFRIKDDVLYFTISKEIFPEHETVIPIIWLRKHCCCDKCLKAEIARHSMTYHDPETEPLPSVNYDPYMNDGTQRTVFECVKNVMERGFCVIKNVPVGKDGIVKEIAEEICPVMDLAYGRIFNIKVAENPQLTSETPLGLFLHQDGTYYEVVPGCQFFHAYEFDDCVEGGESILKDFFQVAEKFREEFPEEFQTFTEVPVVYETIALERNKPSYYQTMKCHIETDYNDQVIAVTWNPGIEGILRVRYEDQARYYKAYKEFQRMLERPENHYNIRLRTGDVLAFNGLRMGHSRNAFSLNDGQRHLQSCYINMDELKSRYITLAHKLGEKVSPTKTGNRSAI